MPVLSAFTEPLKRTVAIDTSGKGAAGGAGVGGAAGAGEAGGTGNAAGNLLPAEDVIEDVNAGAFNGEALANAAFNAMPGELCTTSCGDVDSPVPELRLAPLALLSPCPPAAAGALPRLEAPLSARMAGGTNKRTGDVLGVDTKNESC